MTSRWGPDYLVVALIDEHVLVLGSQVVRTRRDDRVGVGTCRLVVIPVVVRTLHRSVITHVALVGTKRIAAGSQGNTGNHGLGKLLRAMLDGDAAGR